MSTLSAAASRTNGAKSNGPVTPEGKARSAQNSAKHGLCSKEFRLDTPEEKTRFDALFHDLCFVHQAKQEAEKDAVHHLAVAKWRRRVCDNLEAALLHAIERGEACAMTGGDGLPNLATLTRYRARIARDMREAQAEIDAYKAARVKAFEATLTQAREFATLQLRDELAAEMAVEEPEQTNLAPAQVQENKEKNLSELNRRARRRAAKLARKSSRR